MKITSDMIHKDLRSQSNILRGLNKLYGEKGFYIMQKLMRKSYHIKTSSLNCKEVSISRNIGPKLRLCVYKPLDFKESAVGILWLHGGGYAIGAPEQAIPYAKLFCETANCVVVSPDYTLSTERPYPSALEDSYAALLWMKKNSERLGIRNDQIFIGGDSAGGGLAVATAIYARDKAEVNLAFQMPLYPMIDDRMNTNSAKDNDAPVWDSKSNYAAWKMYLGDYFEKNIVPKYAAPARETDFSGLPPAYSFVGYIEPFYDETINYIRKLKEAGIKANATIYKGCFHGFDQVCSKTNIAKRAKARLAKEFKYAVENYFAEQPE